MASTSTPRPKPQAQSQATPAHDAVHDVLEASRLMQDLEALQRELLLTAASAEASNRIGALTQEELSAAKRKFLLGPVRTSRSPGADNERVYTIIIPEADDTTFHFAYFLQPDRHTVGACIGKNHIQQATIICNDCRFAGSQAVIDRDDLFVALANHLPALIQMRMAALHDGFFDPASRSAGSSSSRPSSPITSTSTPAPSPTSN